MLPARPAGPAGSSVPSTFSRPPPARQPFAARAGPAQVRTARRRCPLTGAARRDRRGGRVPVRRVAQLAPRRARRAATDPTRGRRPSAAAAPRPPDVAAFGTRRAADLRPCRQRPHRQDRSCNDEAVTSGRRSQFHRRPATASAAAVREPGGPSSSMPAARSPSRAPPAVTRTVVPGHPPRDRGPVAVASARRCRRTPAGSASPARCRAPGREAAASSSAPPGSRGRRGTEGPSARRATSRRHSAALAA